MGKLDAALDRLAARARGPLERATAMRPELYHDPEMLERERRLLVARDWLCAGLAAEIARPGDYPTFSINDQPILIMRGEDGVARAFSNVCLHRMNLLAAGRGSCSRLVCGYHGWAYDLDAFASDPCGSSTNLAAMPLSNSA